MTFPTGNLAPEGSVIKSTAIDPAVVDADGVYRIDGRARVFTTERAAMRAVKSSGDDRIRPGDVIDFRSHLRQHSSAHVTDASVTLTIEHDTGDVTIGDIN